MADQSFTDALNLMNNFRDTFNNKNYKKANELLINLKLSVLNLSKPLNTDIKLKYILLNREMLEMAVLLSVELKDEILFERNYLQLKTFYFDSDNMSTTISERQYPIIGLYLLFLLSSHRIAEFHTELELIPLEQQHSNKYVSFSRQLEQYYMDGFYNKVLRAAADVPLPNYGFFMSLLSETVREKVAECCEKAYTTIAYNDLAKLLFTESADLKKVCELRGWAVVDNNVNFPVRDEGNVFDIPSKRLISESLSYAYELERII